LNADGHAIVYGTTTSGSLRIMNQSAERMRIDSSGNVVIGTASAFDTSSGRGNISLNGASSALIALGVGGTQKLALFHSGTDCELNNQANGFLAFKTNNSERMRIESDGKIRVTQGIYRGDVNGSGIAFSTNCMIPLNHTGTADDNTEKLGTSGHRWAELHAGNGTIQTSDQNLKQDIESLNDAELSVAASIKSLIKKFRMKDSVESKGDNARIHVGVIAQDVEKVFVAAGLDPRRYSLFCEDELEDGSKRFGIRYEQLLAFVISAL